MAQQDITANTCRNLSHFKEYMKELRRLDDNIMIRLNSTNTHSAAACAELFERLSQAYIRREKAINYCLEVLDGQLTAKQQALDHGMGNASARSALYADDTKRRMIANEFTVEDIVRERSLRVFRDRCRLFTIPEEFEKFLAKRQ
ncbi:hypothetical protein H4R35_004794 [Dimargaris xerosporica]|nr:hypothetical protein H4R35_004794 [Dimargaris xerosporica]